MKTNDLMGAALDWAVEWAETGVCPDPDDFVMRTADESPSTNWAQGGPIIEREFIECTVMPCGHSGITFDTWLATIAVVDEDMIEASGPTPLIAAMRCRVASKLGDTVEVPPELT